MALKQPIRRVAVVLLLIVSLNGTVYLGYDYLWSIFGVPEAQWQFAFMLAPLPIVLGVVAALISQFPRPALPKFLVAASWVAAIVPAVLYVLVSVHAYIA